MPVSQNIKDYFSVPVYRNILDMLNTFDLILSRYANGVNNIILRTSMNDRAAIGHAVGIVGAQSAPWYTSAKYNNKLLVKVKLPKIAITNYYKHKNYGSSGGDEPRLQARDLSRYVALNKNLFRSPVASSAELINLSRTLEYEFNRVRLPLPHNFRQLINKLSPGRSLLILWENLSAISQLYNAISTMRGAVRNEIDAANLAEKVQEETLRLENEELITREEATAQAEFNLIELNTERDLRINSELEQVSNIQEELTILRAELEAALSLLTDQASQTGGSEQNISDQIALTTQINETVQLSQDLKVNETTLLQAANNINVPVNPEMRENIAREVSEIEKTAPNSDAKKPSMVPAIIAGALLVGSQIL